MRKELISRWQCLSRPENNITCYEWTNFQGTVACTVSFENNPLSSVTFSYGTLTGNTSTNCAHLFSSEIIFATAAAFEKSYSSGKILRALKSILKENKALYAKAIRNDCTFFQNHDAVFDSVQRMIEILQMRTSIDGYVISYPTILIHDHVT